MVIYPTIELQHGCVVRLQQSDSNVKTIVSENPVTIAQRWAAQGAEWLHVVNLDGVIGAPLSGALPLAPITSTRLPVADLPSNLQALHEIRQQVKIPIQFGGGLRSLESIRLVFEWGADRAVLGMAAVENPNLICEALRKWGAERVIVGLDAHDGSVAMPSWQSKNVIDAVELGHRLVALGVRTVLYSDIGRADRLASIHAIASARLGDSTGLQVIACGGVGRIEDIELFKEHEYYNISGVVVEPLLEPSLFNFAQAVALSKKPLIRHSAGIVPFRNSGRLDSDNQPEILLIYNYVLEQWQLPRGHIEHGESAAACAQREFCEQSGLQLAEFYPQSAIPLHFVWRIRHYQVERAMTFFVARVGEGEIALTNENHCEAQWCSPSEARLYLKETGSEQLPVLEAALNYWQSHQKRLGD